MTTVRLATTALCGHRVRRSLKPEFQPQPHLLVSYAYMDNFQETRGYIGFQDYVLDSGAFTALGSGKPVELARYAEYCTRLLVNDSKLTEIFALDVIGDWKATLKNTEQLWAANIPAIPTYHAGQPIDALLVMARDYPKVAFGGAVGLPKPKKLAWAMQCMGRIWPKPVHGFGFGSRDTMLQVPFHSTDASNWELRSAGFGNWHAFGKLSVHGRNINLRPEVEYFIKLEEMLAHKWRDALPLVEPDYQRYQAAMQKARGESYASAAVS